MWLSVDRSRHALPVLACHDRPTDPPTHAVTPDIHTPRSSTHTHTRHKTTRLDRATAASRMAEIAKGYFSVCSGRILRIIPAFGLGASLGFVAWCRLVVAGRAQPPPPMMRGSRTLFGGLTHKRNATTTAHGRRLHQRHGQGVVRGRGGGHVPAHGPETYHHEVIIGSAHPYRSICTWRRAGGGRTRVCISYLAGFRS